MADKIINIISNTGTELILNDLSGQTVPYTEQLLISELYPLYLIQYCESLKTYILNNQILVNNGTGTLSTTDAIIYIYGGVTQNSNISNCISYIFASNDKPYYKINSSSYRIITRIKYLGLIQQGLLVNISFIVETNNSNAYLQLWDITIINKYFK